MKIGLVDVDGHNFPNYALMKISAYHKAQGDEVEWANPFFEYDKVYKSKIFTFTPDDLSPYNCEVVKGGTGYDIASKLPKEIEDVLPDYSIYNVKGVSYGFLTRGCPNRCKWCIVPSKEGHVKPYRDIDEIAQGNKKIILMDNNILASDYGLEQLEKIANKGYRVDFNQGLDARLVTDDIAKLLCRIKWIDKIRFACDTQSQIKSIFDAKDKLHSYGHKRGIFIYFLIKDLDDCMTRIKALSQYKDVFIPFGQPYREFDKVNEIPQWQKDMAHWMNQHYVYQSCNFEDFEPRKGFKCKEYLR